MIDIAKFESIYLENIDDNKQHESIVDIVQKRQLSDIEFAESDLESIEALFHDLAYYRCKNSIDTIKWLEGNPDEFPKINNELLNEKEPGYFAVSGMYGGFSYGLFNRDGKPVLITQSWSRVVGGSGQTHEITPDHVTMVEKGFV